jgi:hypothetical protein
VYVINKVKMSVSSLSTQNLGQGSYPLVIQQGVITKVAATPLVVACDGILATDDVVLVCLTKTAATANAGGVEVITIQANVSFTATSADAVFAGSYAYQVCRSSARTVNAP